MAESFWSPHATPGTLSYWSYNPGGIFNKKKKGPQMIEPKPYSGLRPYSGADVGLGAPELKSLSDQYRSQIMERSQGKGLVGFDPEYRNLLRSEFTQDLEDDFAEQNRMMQAKAASQGQRGGIPLDLSTRAYKDYGRRRASGLAEIDIADLEARRADINAATFAQPELVGLGAGIQQNRAAFDLSEYNATQPTLIDEAPSNVGPALVNAAATLGGAYLGSRGTDQIAQLLMGQMQPDALGMAYATKKRPSYNYQDPLLSSLGYGYRKPY